MQTTEDQRLHGSRDAEGHGLGLQEFRSHECKGVRECKEMQGFRAYECKGLRDCKKMLLGARDERVQSNNKFEAYFEV